VRVLKKLNRNSDAQEFSLPVDATAAVSPNIRLVVFAVDTRTGKVAAAAESILKR